MVRPADPTPVTTSRQRRASVLFALLARLKEGPFDGELTESDMPQLWRRLEGGKVVMLPEKIYAELCDGARAVTAVASLLLHTVIRHSVTGRHYLLWRSFESKRCYARAILEEERLVAEQILGFGTTSSGIPDKARSVNRLRRVAPDDVFYFADGSMGWRDGSSPSPTSEPVVVRIGILDQALNGGLLVYDTHLVSLEDGSDPPEVMVREAPTSPAASPSRTSADRPSQAERLAIARAALKAATASQPPAESALAALTGGGTVLHLPPRELDEDELGERLERANVIVQIPRAVHSRMLDGWRVRCRFGQVKVLEEDGGAWRLLWSASGNYYTRRLTEREASELVPEPAAA